MRDGAVDRAYVGSVSTTDDVRATAPATTVARRAAAPATLPVITAGGLTWRGARQGDAPAIRKLLNDIAAADDEPFRWTLDEIVEALAAPYRDPGADFLLGFEESPDGVGRLCAYADVNTPPGDSTVARAILTGGVRPDRRGEGIGRELLAWQIARGRQMLAAAHLAHEHVPAWLIIFLGDESPASRSRTYERAGFRARRYYSDLRRDLSRPVQEAGADLSGGTLRLVPWTSDLDEATRLARNDAFRDHFGSQPRTPQTWAQYRTAFMPGWTWLVVDDAPDVGALLASPDTDDETAAALRAGEPLVAAYQVASKFTEDFEVRGYEFGYSDNVGVRRAYRGRGLASVALTAALRAMADDGMRYAHLGVDAENPTGALGLYAGLGYEKVSSSRMLTIEL